ncbi:MAG: LodA/GoxA family CTQ-dependent oxidase [Nitrospirales bacterium]|nr:LodA/GoxA family CTQ-dependent oxidase [Nitrospirales bacterium]
MASVYKIFPPIGIARIGNSESVYFIGPESPGKQPSGPFRDRSTNKKIKPQAVRFRIYKFERDEFGKEVCQEEITVKKGIAIEWSIHLINRKAAGGRFPPGGPTPDLRNYGYDRQGLTINSQMHSITGKSKPEEKLTGEISFIKNGVVEGTANVNLGRIITDQKGRLLVIGGTGESKSPLNKGLTGFANNDGWYDGVSDGPVRARILIGENEPIEAEGGAWALIAPPSYAPEIENVVTWYDQAMNVNSRSFSPELKTMVPSFTKDIYPILKRTTLLS